MESLIKDRCDYKETDKDKFHNNIVSSLTQTTRNRFCVLS